MKITLFTSNSLRHNYLINMLSACCEKLFVIQEDVTKISKTTLKKDSNSILMKKYFNEVMLAQKNIFKKKIYKVKKENTNIISIQEGELNKLCLSKIDNFLKSDIYIVYGSSYIKGDLVEFLINVVEMIKEKVINNNQKFLTTDFQYFQFLSDFEIYHKYLFQNHKNLFF